MSEISRIRLLVADDHPLVRSGIRNAMSVFTDMEIVFEAANGLEALEFIEKHEADVALVDLFMPEADGYCVIESISGNIPCIALTSSQIPEEILKAVKCGASCVLMKNVGGDIIASAIRSVFAGEPFYEKTVTDLIIKSQILSGSRGDPFELLTAREIEVLKLVARGLTNNEIGERLFICRKTVKFHVSNILAKTGVPDRIKLAVLYNEKRGK